MVTLRKLQFKWQLFYICIVIFPIQLDWQVNLFPLLLNKHAIAAYLNQKADQFFPRHIYLMVSDDKKMKVSVEYTLHERFQAYVYALFEKYAPNYGAYVALDPVSGKILALVGFDNQKVNNDFALKALFPSASVFKVITAAAAIDRKSFTADTPLPFYGRPHTLYKKQIFNLPLVTKEKDQISFRLAFAKSINSVFGQIGVYSVGPLLLEDYAHRFGFNRQIDSDVIFEPGRAIIPENDWGIAECASGFTRDNKMSAVQGALIAGAIVNNGFMMEPYIVNSLHDEMGFSYYDAKPRIAGFTMSPQTAEQLRIMMAETILSGTSRKAFRGFFQDQDGVEVGGKTGTLNSEAPKGKTDWFVGYLKMEQQQIAIAVLMVNSQYSRTKSADLARRSFEFLLADFGIPLKTR